MSFATWPAARWKAVNGGDAFRFSLVKECVPRRSNLRRTVRSDLPLRNLPHNAINLYPAGLLSVDALHKR